jgi:hypothetical protein
MAANKLTSYMYLQVEALCLVPGLPAGCYIQWMSNIVKPLPTTSSVARVGREVRLARAASPGGGKNNVLTL